MRTLALNSPVPWYRYVIDEVAVFPAVTVVLEVLDGERGSHRPVEVEMGRERLVSGRRRRELDEDRPDAARSVRLERGQVHGRGTDHGRRGRWRRRTRSGRDQGRGHRTICDSRRADRCCRERGVMRRKGRDAGEKENHPEHPQGTGRTALGPPRRSRSPAHGWGGPTSGTHMSVTTCSHSDGRTDGDDDERRSPARGEEHHSGDRVERDRRPSPSLRVRQPERPSIYRARSRRHA